MSDLQSLGQQIQRRLQAVEEKERRQQVQLQARMADIEKRHVRFEQLADELLADIVDSRIKKLASFFDNAKLLERNALQKHRWICGFTHCDRYPASVKLAMSIGHDSDINHLLLIYDLEILPVFFKFEKHDEAAFPLDDPSEQRMQEWVDEKILTFVETYVRLQQTDQYQQSSLVTDPVCGMRFRKVIASAKTERAGHTYFFCSQGCQDKFTAGPQRYVSSPGDGSLHGRGSS